MHTHAHAHTVRTPFRPSFPESQARQIHTYIHTYMHACIRTCITHLCHGCHRRHHSLQVTHQQLHYYSYIEDGRERFKEANLLIGYILSRLLFLTMGEPRKKWYCLQGFCGGGGGERGLGRRVTNLLIDDQLTMSDFRYFIVGGPYSELVGSELFDVEHTPRM